MNVPEEPPGSAGRVPEPSWAQKVLILNERLDQAGLPYAFGGAIALNYHREPRSTLDVDINIFVPPERREEILDVLSAAYPIEDRGHIERQLATDGQARTRWHNTYIDIFLANTDFHASMASRRERRPFDGVEIPVLSIEDLLVCKVLFDRAKDWLDIEAVAAAEGDKLDLAYMSRWLTYFLGGEEAQTHLLRSAFDPHRPGFSP